MISLSHRFDWVVTNFPAVSGWLSVKWMLLDESFKRDNIDAKLIPVSFHPSSFFNKITAIWSYKKQNARKMNFKNLCRMR